MITLWSGIGKRAEIEHCQRLYLKFCNGQILHQNYIKLPQQFCSHFIFTVSFWGDSNTM